LFVKKVNNDKIRIIMEMIRDFKKITRSDASIAGGKGASLGEMTSAGIFVPPGFVVLSAAFDKFLENSDLNVEIDSILHAVNHKEMRTVENASERIKDLILKAPIPQDIKEEITKEFKKLKSQFVAVRSSATAEDSSSAAWAGQLDTFLNTTEKTLLVNVQKCWASLFTPRAIFYRFEKGLHNSKISVAVVIQKMIESEVSGIAFSVHPVTQDRNQMIIEAGYGLGEAIVSGQITPDSYVIEKNPRRIIDKNISLQERGIYRKPKEGDNEWQTIPQDKGEKQKLTDGQILELSELILKIENHYGFPVDIEWAFENDKFYITQSRPITTLKINTRETLADKFIAALGNQEMFPPVHNSTIFVQTSGGDMEKYYGKNYSDKTTFPLLITAKKNDGIMFVPFTKIKKISEELFKLFWRDEKTLVERLKKYKKQTRVIDQIYSKITSRNFVEREKFSNLAQCAEQIRAASWEMDTLASFSLYFDKEMCIRLLDKVGSKIDKKQLDIIWKKGITPVSKSFEKNRELHLLKLLEHKKNWQEIGTECQYFGANYNKISSPKEVENELKGKFARFEKKEERKKIIEKRKTEKEKIISEYNTWLAILSPEEKKLVRYLQAIIELRDDRKDYLAKFFVAVFKIAQKLFREANIDEKLIYFYMFDEIIKGRNYLLKNKIALENRLNGFTAFLNYNGAVEIEYGTFEDTKTKLEHFFISQQNKEVDTRIINGQSGSHGKIQGIVRVVMNTEKESSKFNKGDVLVTGMTRPEFVPLMKKSSAIITNEGGITCHAAIISRELGKPCIIGTKIATKVLHDGDLVEVDADNGVVRILERAK